MQTIRPWVLFFTIAALTVSCSHEEPLAPVVADEPQHVSLVQLIATPDVYHNRVVRIVGFCRLEFEGDAVFLHREDSESSISKNGIWLNVGSPIPEEQQSLSGEYVLLEATFLADRKGHLGAYSGEFDDIQRLERWPSRAEVERMLRRTPRP